LTIVGAGGIGKTRLGLAAAAWIAEHAPPDDGVWWIEMAAVRDATAVAAAIAATIGLQLPAGRPALDALASALGDERALLVLDNCEQVAEGVAALVAALRVQARQVAVLITSQTPIGVAAEQLYRLGTLDVPETATLESAAASGAVALLVERTAALDAHFALTAANVQAVVDICRLLDGIALALEMAAARVPLLGIHGVRDKLDQRLDLLSDRARDRPARQQTLRAALDWSWSLLSHEEQAVLRRLGVFAGGFTLGLAQDVVADAQRDGWRVLDLLGSLVDKSLVVNEGGDPPRYRLLETTRTAALERLALAGEDASARQQHAQAMLRSLESAEQARWSDAAAEEAAIVRELDNARAAFDWSLSAGEQRLALELHAASMPLWVTAGLKAEGARRCEALAAQVDDSVPAALAARFWLTVAMMGLFSSRQACAETARRL
jgi:predicted ATPase